MNKEKFYEKWDKILKDNTGWSFIRVFKEQFKQDLDKFETHIKENCAKKVIDKIFIGIDRKHTVGWHSYFKIGNQTFYMATCETKNEAEWFAEQLTHAIMSITKTIRGNK